MAGKRWLLIVDLTLISFEGHSYNYDMSVAEAAAGLVDEVIVFADRDFSVPIDSHVEIKPVLNRISIEKLKSLSNRVFSKLPNRKSRLVEQPCVANATVISSVPSWVVNFGKNLRSWDFAFSLRRICSAVPAMTGDEVHILIQHANIAELVGLEHLPESLLNRRHVRFIFHLVLRYEPQIIYSGYETEAAFKVRILNLLNASEQSNSDVRFYTDSDQLTQSYQALGLDAVKFVTLPIPTLTGDLGGSSPDSLRDGKVRMAMLGSSRIEKGFGYLQEILASLQDFYAEIEVAIQVTRGSGDVRIQEISDWLDTYVLQWSEHGLLVKVLNGPVPEDEYFSWFANTDILLAPYISTKYAASTSGVFVEALHFGVPTVTLEGTWMATLIRAAALEGYRIGEIASDPQDMGKKAVLVSRELHKYRHDVYEYLNVWKRFNNQKNFVEILLGSHAKNFTPKKVVHVYRTYFPDPPGGLQEAIRQIALSAKTEGVESQIFTLSQHQAPREIAMQEGLVVRERSLGAPASCDIGGLASFRTFSKLSRESDVIHFHFPWPFADLLQLVVRPSAAAVMTYHSDIVRQHRLGKLYAPMMNNMLDSMSVIIATSPAYALTSPVLTRTEVMGKVRVIPLGINESSYPSLGDDEVLNRLGIWNKEYFLFIGVLRYYKGVHFLIDAARSTNSLIVIAGTGPEQVKLKLLVERHKLKNVIFTGQISDSEKVSLLKGCKALVLPSHLRSEAFGMVLVEASMLGKPMISCEIGTGTSYVNLHGVTGLVVPPASHEALAEAMKCLLGDYNMANSMGLAARVRYEKLFSGPALGQAYSSLYREVCG